MPKLNSKEISETKEKSEIREKSETNDLLDLEAEM